MKVSTLNWIIKWLKIVSLVAFLAFVLRGLFGVVIRTRTQSTIPYETMDALKAWLIVTGYLVVALALRRWLQNREKSQ